MSNVVFQCERLVRLIDGFHRAIAHGKQPTRRHFEVIFFVGGRMAMQIERDFFRIPSEEEFLHAIQYANIRYPFEEVLLVDMIPNKTVTYKAASRDGAYAEDVYVWDEESSSFRVEDGEAIKKVEVPPLFERPNALVPPRIASWVNAYLHHAALPRL